MSGLTSSDSIKIVCECYFIMEIKTRRLKKMKIFNALDKQTIAFWNNFILLVCIVIVNIE